MKNWGDVQLEKIVAWLLISGVALAALVVLAGAAGFLWQYGIQSPDHHVFHGVPPQYRDIRGVISAAGPSDWRAVIQLGLLLLILTPIARVAFSLAGFALERDRTYVVLTALVLAILLYSFIAPH
jgi:uncharacterized membrane protein